MSDEKFNPTVIVIPDVLTSFSLFVGPEAHNKTPRSLVIAIRPYSVQMVAIHMSDQKFYPTVIPDVLTSFLLRQAVDSLDHHNNCCSCCLPTLSKYANADFPCRDVRSPDQLCVLGKRALGVPRSAAFRARVFAAVAKFTNVKGALAFAASIVA